MALAAVVGVVLGCSDTQMGRVHARGVVAVHAGRGLPVRGIMSRVFHRVDFYPVLFRRNVVHMIAGGLTFFQIFATG